MTLLEDLRNIAREVPVKIQISGKPGEGKSTIAKLLVAVLRHMSFHVELDDPDDCLKTKEQELLGLLQTVRLERLAEKNTRITIQVVNEPPVEWKTTTQQNIQELAKRLKEEINRLPKLGDSYRDTSDEGDMCDMDEVNKTIERVLNSKEKPPQQEPKNNMEESIEYEPCGCPNGSICRHAFTRALKLRQVKRAKV